MDTPETDTPEADISETDTPETDTPETYTPETDTSENDTPEANTPEANTPEANTPGTDTPKTNTPETGTPGTNTSVTDIPETGTPGTDTPETNMGTLTHLVDGGSIMLNYLCFLSHMNIAKCVITPKLHTNLVSKTYLLPTSLFMHVKDNTLLRLLLCFSSWVFFAIITIIKIPIILSAPHS